MTYTKGKWEYWEETEDHGFYIVDSNNRTICDLYHMEGGLHTFDDAEANAKHIVKCVNSHDELIEALEEVLKTIDESGEWWMDCPNKGGFDIGEIEAILEKARGE